MHAYLAGLLEESLVLDALEQPQRPVQLRHVHRTRSLRKGGHKEFQRKMLYNGYKAMQRVIQHSLEGVHRERGKAWMDHAAMSGRSSPVEHMHVNTHHYETTLMGLIEVGRPLGVTWWRRSMFCVMMLSLRPSAAILRCRAAYTQHAS